MSSHTNDNNLLWRIDLHRHEVYICQNNTHAQLGVSGTTNCLSHISHITSKSIKGLAAVASRKPPAEFTEVRRL